LYCYDDLKQRTSMSGFVAQHITTSPYALEMDHFGAVAEYHEYEDAVEDEEDIGDEGDQQIEEVLEDDGSEDEEEREEYLEDADDECCDADDVQSVNSLSEEGEVVDVTESDVACDTSVNDEICEALNSEDVELVVSQSSNCAAEKFKNSSDNSSR